MQKVTYVVLAEHTSFQIFWKIGSFESLEEAKMAMATAPDGDKDDVVFHLVLVQKKDCEG